MGHPSRHHNWILKRISFWAVRGLRSAAMITSKWLHATLKHTDQCLETTPQPIFAGSSAFPYPRNQHQQAHLPQCFPIGSPPSTRSIHLGKISEADIDGWPGTCAAALELLPFVHRAAV